MQHIMSNTNPQEGREDTSLSNAIAERDGSLIGAMLNMVLRVMDG